MDAKIDFESRIAHKLGDSLANGKDENSKNVTITHKVAQSYQNADGYDHDYANIAKTYQFNIKWDTNLYLEFNEYLKRYHYTTLERISGFGYEDPLLKQALNEFLNLKYGLYYGDNVEFELDDFNYINTFKSDKYISSNALENLFKSDFHQSGMILRAVMMSLNLRPYIDEIPYEYMISVFNDYYELSEEELNALLTEYESKRNPALRERILAFYTLYRYNQHLHMLAGYKLNSDEDSDVTHSIEFARNKGGSLRLNIEPTDYINTMIIRALKMNKEPLNTEKYVNTFDGTSFTAILKDTEKSYMECFGTDYRSILNYAGLPESYNISGSIL